MAPPTAAPEAPRRHQLCFPRANLGDEKLLQWSQDREAPDGGPALLQQMGSQFLNLIDFNNNDLTDKGASVIVDFLQEHKMPVKKLKLYGNRLTSCEAICRLLEDPEIGLQNADSLQELHLSHNDLSAASLEDLLNTVAQCKRPGTISPPLWIRLEKNNIAAEDVAEVAQRLDDQLSVCFDGSTNADGDCTVSACAAGADVHIVL